MTSENYAVNGHAALLISLAPITSILVIPSIQGTTPGYILSFLSFFLVLIKNRDHVDKYLAILFWCFFIWFGFFSFSQLISLIFPNKIFVSGLVLVNPSDSSEILRSSLFTQSIYLMAVIFYGTYVYCFYSKHWDSWLKVGITFMSIYGIYEFIYFLLFKESGDFISNRMFGEDMEATGSAMQTMVIADIWLTRIKSLTGEPSMYAFTMMPFLFYAYAMRWSLPVRLVMTVSVVLTASTSALLAALVALGVSIMHGRIRMRLIGVMVGMIALAFVLNYGFVMDLIDQVILAKALGENFSGSDRSDTFGAMLDYWKGLNPLAQLVGVGFGYVRSTDFFSTLLVNCGLLGLTGFVSLFIYPVLRLGRDDRSIALKQCLLATLIVMLVSVPEYAYLAPWTFLAIAYREISNPAQTEEIMDTTPET